MNLGLFKNIIMKKIATHDSATGEKPKNFLSWLMIPFAKTQSKTIKQQYEAGCRMFDIRVRFDKSLFKLYCAHGLFMTKRTAYDILQEINSFEDSCYVSITYEGKLSNSSKNFFIELIEEFQVKLTNILWEQTAVKYTNNDIKVDWEVILPAKCSEKAIQGFLPLDGKNWQTLIPIPWLWKKIYFNEPIFSYEYYTYVDFL